jgi:hypothetical protein
LKASLENWTIVLNGLWNLRLFGPEWVAANLFDNEHLEVELLVRPGLHGVRYTSRRNMLQFLPANDRIVVAVRSTSDDMLGNAERLAKAVLTTLPHTPVTGVGINFGFTEPAPSVDQLRIFEFTDNARLAGLASPVVATEIKRSFPYQGRRLNLTQSIENTELKVHFNFHADVRDANEAATTLAGVSEKRQFSYRLLQDVYGIDVEPEGTDGRNEQPAEGA